MIRRLQPGYHPIGVLHSHSKRGKEDKILSALRRPIPGSSTVRPKIMMLGDPKPSDYDLWLECRNCGTLYPKHEVKVEPELEPIKEPSDGKQSKSQVIETKPKKRTGRGSNPRLKGNKWEIKDEELKAELKGGVVLLAYQSNDPSEPVV